SEAPTGLSRRRWMQLMGASFGLAAGAAGCRVPEETIAPLAVRPENRVPGKPEKFASMLHVAGKVRPIVATSYDGRPIKVDGNSLHAEGSGTDVFTQAAVLELYDPDRSRGLVQREGKERFSRDWNEFFTAWRDISSAEGEKVAFLVGSHDSPSVKAQIDRVAERLPQAQWYKHDPLAQSKADSATGQAFGSAMTPRYQLENADVLLLLDADFFGHEAASGLRNLREYTQRRAPEAGPMNRLFVVESHFTTAGLAADHRMPLETSRVGSFVADLEARLEVRLGQEESSEPGEDAEKREKFIASVVEDLVSHQGRGLVVGGPHLDEATQVRIWRINSRLQNLGATVELVRRADTQPTSIGSLSELAQGLENGQFETVVVLGGNPLYDAPGDVKFAEAYAKAAQRIFFGYYENETSRLSTWHLPEAHGLESWGDGIAADGRYCTAQPLIDPIFGGKSLIELLAQMAGETSLTGRDMVRQTAASHLGIEMTEARWNKLLHDGFAADSQGEAIAATLADDLQLAEVNTSAWQADRGDALEVNFRIGATYDGRYANNGWLQELPDPMTKVTWDNVLTVNPNTAKKLGLAQDTLAKLTVAGQSVLMPVYLMPGLAAGTLGVTLGYGRSFAGMIGGNLDEQIDPVGVNVYPLRKSDALDYATGVTVEPTGTKYELSTTQDHHAIDTLGLEEMGRRVGALVREGTVSEFEAHPDFAEHRVHHPPLESLWTELSYDGHAWGMSIDMSKCVGCNACTIACQAENNVPIVGKEQVAKGREMHWIRVDRYFSGDMDEPHAVTQPVTCQHCENAPCEQVCPVAATVHSDEGLNDMVYNRCIGTRYCGNNCPYKVRRFNYLDYRAGDHQFEEANRELAQLVFNPEVTVRNRGVMEKCTYCVQRIQNTKIEARAERRPIGPNEVRTACQEACPAQAIEFGDLNNGESRVAANHENPRAYAMLAELNVKPRTKYLARIRNPHPWLAAEEDHGPGHEEGHEHE
ncbi:MAG: 4Fe-4S dicluster domain-containing protein, partial [Pirellulaceae bacterium]